MHKLTTLSIGVLGEAGIHAAGMIDPTDAANIGDLILKIVIAAVTVWGLLKKKPQKD